MYPGPGLLLHEIVERGELGLAWEAHLLEEREVVRKLVDL